MIQSYNYQPFQKPTQEIRLLTVLGGEDEEEIHIDLTNFNRDAVAYEYDAISYTWGQPGPSYAIYIDGKALELRQNAYLFLKHLRKTRITRRKIWIDAICIDQQNIKEKEALVPGIGQIFHKAATVLVWFDWTSINVHLEPEVIDLFASADDTTICFLHDLRTRLPNVQNLQLLHDKLMMCTYHTYWNRLWIVQELALAQCACFVFGRQLVPAAAIANMRIWCWGRGQRV